jgi:chromosome segregation ATPase
MHIKQVIVEGFKCYKDRIEAAPFSPKHNVVGEQRQHIGPHAPDFN